MADSAELTRRRMVIWRALEHQLSTVEQQQAMDLWSTEFQQEAAFQPMLFLKRLSEKTDLGSRQGEIRKQLVRLMFKKLPELESGSPVAAGAVSAPAPAAAAPAPAASSFAGPPLTGKDRVFSTLLAVIIGEAKNHTGLIGRLQGLILQRFRTLGLTATATLEVQGWATSTSTLETPQLRGLQADEMAKLIDLIYIEMCEDLGPPRTDRLFGRALRKADELPEARNFSPRQLF